jgi:hypothetical protein
MDTQAETRLTGKVKWFDPKRGYGFITANNQDYFAHVADIVGNLRSWKMTRFRPLLATARMVGARP